MTAILLLNVAVLSFWLPVVHPCTVTIHPKEPAVVFGGSLNLNCTFSCTNYTKSRWEASLAGLSKEGDGWISLSITNATEWTFQPICLVSYGESKQHLTKVVVYVYQFSTPDIYLAPEIVDGHSERIICNISRLRVRDSVPRNLNISLSRGGNILNSTHGDQSVEYSFVSSLLQDDGAEILCVAYVQVGSEVLKKSSNRTLKIVGSPYNVSISRDHITYKADETIVVTCNAEGKPLPEFSWDLPSKARVEFSDSNKTVTIRSAQSSHNGTYRCLAHNAYGKSSTQVDILFEEFSTPDIYLAAEIVDGRLERIICNISRLRVRGSIPHNLNISLSRDGNILNSTHGNPSVEYSFVASLQQDDEAEILCVAYIPVGSEVLEKSSHRTLRIVGSPYNVRVSTDHVTYKADAKIVVTCNAEGKPFPEFSWDLPSKARVEFSDSNKTVTIHSAQSSHNGTYRCLARNAYGKSLAQVDILFEEFSTPDIYLASEIVDGRLERIICNISCLRVRGSIPRNLNISLSRDGNILNSNHGKPSVEYSFVSSLQQDDGAEILCVAYVQVGSELLKKSSNRTLRIVGSPYNVSVSRDQITYKADETIVVACNAEGKPFPEFSWDLPSKARVEFSDSNKTVTIRSAQSSHNGTYRCLARNAYGKSSAQVDILFEEHSRSWITAVVVLVSLLLVAGFTGGIFWYYCRT